MNDNLKLRLRTTAEGGLLGLLVVGGIGLAVEKLWIAIPGALLGAYVGWCSVPSSLKLTHRPAGGLGASIR